MLAGRPRGGRTPLPAAHVPPEAAAGGGWGLTSIFPTKGRSGLIVLLRTRITAKRLSFSSLFYFNLSCFRSGEQYCPFINPSSCARSQL